MDVPTAMAAVRTTDWLPVISLVLCSGTNSTSRFGRAVYANAVAMDTVTTSAVMPTTEPRKTKNAAHAIMNRVVPSSNDARAPTAAEILPATG